MKLELEVPSEESSVRILWIPLLEIFWSGFVQESQDLLLGFLHETRNSINGFFMCILT